MRNSENLKFEEEWSQAFEGAEVAPSESVWTSIDLKLSHAESGNMRRRVVFYQRLAAASVFFAVCITEQSEANVTAKGDNQNLSAGIRAKSTESSKPTESFSDANQKGSKSLVKENSTSVVMNQHNQQPVANAGDKTIDLSETKSTAVVSQELKTEPKWYDVTLAKKLDLLASLNVKGKPVDQVAGARKFKEVKKEASSNKPEDWWASVNGSGGVYNQTTTSNSIASTAFMTSANANLRAIPTSTAASTGTSYSYGVSVGKTVAKRLVLMTGISYLNQSIDYNSNIVVLDASNQSKAYLADIVSEATNLATTTPYTIRNTNEFVSFPLQAGYLILNRKAGIQLNAGVAADLFYRNTIADQSGRISSYSQNAGDNSVYRTVNWTGLLGTELSYKMNNHYRISLVPGFRYSFDSVLKSTTGSTINPLVWDVGFRFKYIF
jgi:hypothetical protein